MFLYMWQNNVSGNSYYGITKETVRRNISHRYSARGKSKTPFYDSIRAYGWEQFEFTILSEGSDTHIAMLEQQCIAYDATCYNLHQGGHIGFDVSTKTEKEVASWKDKLRCARKGRTPAAGMTHTEETKRLCGDYGKLRWDMYGRYPKEVLDYGFTESNRKFGISKTHYYRLRKAVAE